MLSKVKLAKLQVLVVCIALATAGLLSPRIYAESLEDREKALQEREKELERREQQLESQLATTTDTGSPSISGMEDVLPTAKAGQCFAKVLVPAEYKNVTEKVVIQEASHKIDIVPAKYEKVKERVTIKEASEKVVEVPVVYEKVTERILVEPAQKVWRKANNNKSKLAPADWISAAIASGIPKEAPLGACFEEAYQPALVETIDEKVLKRQAASRIEIIPAKYEWAEKKILIKEASEKIVEVPPVYETKKEQVLERAAYQTWKQGRGPIERIDNLTGQIMCLIEVPAKYNTVTKKVIKTPATTQKIQVPAEYKTIRIQKQVNPPQERVIEIPAEFQVVEKKVKKRAEIIGWRPENTVGEGSPTGKKICRVEIPGKYKTITKQVIKSPATAEKTLIAAEFKEIDVMKLVAPTQESKTEIPAKHQTVTKRVKVHGEKLAWRSVLCETNTSKGLVTKIQSALKQAGYNPGPVDGSMGHQTQVAINQFQKKKGFERGGLTFRTLDALGVQVGNSP